MEGFSRRRKEITHCITGTFVFAHLGVHLHWSDLLLSGLFFAMVAIVEETMMRGYVLGRLLRTRLNKFISFLISSLLFALLHLMNPNVAFLPMLNLVLGGLLLGASYLYTRNLWFPISLHFFICLARAQVQRPVRVIWISHCQRVPFSTVLKLTFPYLGP